MEHWWNDYPWRLVQTNLRETDMVDMDARNYAAWLKSTKATVAMINTGGIVASYPTEVEDHTRSEYLLGDSLHMVMDECHKAGIKVIARMDFSKARRAVYERHPDWAYRDIDGNIVDYNGDVHMCISGGFQQEKALEILREAANVLPIDGVFMNMGGFQTKDYSYRDYGPCHCSNCRRLFKQRFGEEIPQKEDPDDPVSRMYQIFKREIVDETRGRINALIKSINPEIAVDGVDFFRRESNTEYKRGGSLWQYNASSAARVIRSLKPDCICSSASIDYIGFFYRHISVGAQLHALRMRQTIANFGSLDYYLIGRMDNHRDKSAFPAVKAAFSYMEKHESVYSGMAPYGEILVIREGKHMASEEARGWIRVLTESHLLLSEAEPQMAWAYDQLSRFKAIILTDIHEFSDQAASILDAYVHGGGCLICTGATGILNEHGGQRDNLPFSCLGTERIRSFRKDMASAMLEIGSGEREDFPSLTDTDLICFGDDFLFADYQNTVCKYLHLTPPHPLGPPERCCYQDATDLPGMTVNFYGKGKAIHIPWLAGKIFQRDSYPNTFCFMQDVLKRFAGLENVEEAPFSPMVEVTLGYSRDNSHAMVHLVNNSGHFGCSYFEPIPVRDIRLKIRMESKPTAIFLLTGGNAPQYRWEDGYLFLSVEFLDTFAAIDIRFDSMRLEEFDG